MAKATVLIIDDALDVTEILKFHLEKKYKVIVAHNGRDGLALIREHHPNLVILDINMPVMGGIELYDRICAGKDKPPFPVVIITVREELAGLFKDLNVDGFITKPFETASVLAEIDTVMSKRYGIVLGEGIRTSSEVKTVLVVEDDLKVFNQIVISFLNAGYRVDSAKDGFGAIERIMVALPDLVVIKLGLPDISGDLVCVKLKQMPRTMDLPFILYTRENSLLDRAVVDKICQIINARLIETNDPGLLLQEADHILKNPKNKS